MKRKMHNKRGMFKIKIVLIYQSANLNLDVLVLILVVIWLRYECLKLDSVFKILKKELNPI